MMLTYFLNDFEIAPVAPIIIGISFDLTFHTVFILIQFLIQAYVNGGRQCCNYTFSCKYIFL